MEISSIATALSFPGTIYVDRLDLNVFHDETTNNISMPRTRKHKVVVRGFNIAKVPLGVCYDDIFGSLGKAYCSNMPSTVRPRSFVSRAMRRASMRSESACTNICKVSMSR